jgi:hypothetical protein
MPTALTSQPFPDHCTEAAKHNPAMQTLGSLVGALLRTHWAPQQSLAEFQHELDEAVEFLHEHEAAAA